MNCCGGSMSSTDFMVRPEIGAEVVATGHYAKVDRLPNGRYAIKNSASAKKDDSSLGRLMKIFRECVTSYDIAQNIIVIKCNLKM